MTDGIERTVFINRLVSVSVTSAPEAYKPATHSAEELLGLIDARRRKGFAIEYLGAEDDADEVLRKANGTGYDVLRLRAHRLIQNGEARYVALLIEYVDQTSRSFPVVDVSSFHGRELAGEDDERGAFSAHLVVRLPPPDSYDDGSYRCVVEYAPPITRAMIERFLSRQLRRIASAEDWHFLVDIKGSKKAKEKKYKYHPKLQLLSDFGRTLRASRGKTLTHVVFSKRQERQSAGAPTEIEQQDFLADVEFRVSAKQAPEDPEEKQSFFASIKRHYEQMGYETRYYFRYASGGTVSGELSKADEGAADLMYCQREKIVLKHARKPWVSTIDKSLTDEMIALLDKDELWQLG